MGLSRVLGVENEPWIGQSSKFDFAGRAHSPAYQASTAHHLLDLVSHLSRATCKAQTCWAAAKTVIEKGPPRDTFGGQP